MKREENVKFKNFFFSKILKKNQTTSYQYQKLCSTPHDMVLIPANFEKIQECVLSYSAKTKCDRQTDRQTDGRMGGVSISPVLGLLDKTIRHSQWGMPN